MPSHVTVQTKTDNSLDLTESQIKELVSTADPLPGLALSALQGGRALRFAGDHGLKAGDMIAISDASDPTAPPILVSVDRVGGYSVAIDMRLPSDFDPADTVITKVPSVDSVAYPSPETDPAAQEDAPEAVDTAVVEPAQIEEAISALSTQVIKIPLGAKTAEVQSLIDTAPPGATLEFAAGDYIITETLTINRSDLSLIGAGSDATRLIQSSALKGAPVIEVGPSWLPKTLEELPELAYTAVEGARTLRFSEGHGLQKGDVIYISQENTPEFFADIGDTKWQKENPLRTMIVTVEQVGGNSIAISEHLPFNFDPALTTVSKMDPLVGLEISGLELTATYGASDPSNFSNTLSDEYRMAMIDIKNTDGMQMSDIHIEEPGSLGINLASSVDADFSGISVHGAHNKGAGGNGYGLQIRDVYTSSFTDLEMFDTRHGVLFSSYQTAIGNYVEVTDTNRDVNFHGGLDQDNTVVVHSSMRSSSEKYHLASVVYFNEGESWGAPTDPDKNDVRFVETNGTNKSDRIVAHEDGAVISGFEAADLIWGNRGDDLIFGETGHDVIYASGGSDQIDGGSGLDTLILAGALDDYTVTKIHDGFIIERGADVTEVVDVETFDFADLSLTQSQLNDIA